MQMKRSLYFTLATAAAILLLTKLISLSMGVFFSSPATASLRVVSTPAGADVYLEGSLKGKTPYEEGNFKNSPVMVKIVSQEGQWEGKVALNAGTWTVIQRDLTSDPQTQAGEILTLQTGEGLSVISSPDQAVVEVDGKSMGKTPLKLNLPAGEYIFVVKKDNFLQRTIKATIPEDYHLTLNAELALTEGVDLSAVNLPTQSASIMIKVLATPTGFLRVRDKPSLSGKELARVKPGDELLFMEEENTWFKVRLPNGLEGYISSAYGQKQNQ